MVLVGFSVRHVRELSSPQKALLDRLGFHWQLASVAQEAKGVAASFPSFGKGAASVETVARSPQEPESLGKATASGETVARSPQVPRSVGKSAASGETVARSPQEQEPESIGKAAASGETVARSPQVPRSVGKGAASGETVARSPQEPYAGGKETASGETVARSRRGHPSVRSTELMTMGVEFQSAEGLVMVPETESESECTPPAVDSFPFPPASPLEPGSCSPAGGIGPVSRAPLSLALPSYPADTCEPSVEPFDPTTSRAFGQPLVCRHSKGYREFVDGLGLCSPGRWRPKQRGRLCSWRESNHAEGLQRIIRNLVISELDDVKLMTFRLAAGQIESSPFRPEAMQRLREELASMTPDPGLALSVPERQPFYLHLLAQSLRELGDPDWAFLTQGMNVFRVGFRLGMRSLWKGCRKSSVRGSKKGGLMRVLTIRTWTTILLQSSPEISLRHTSERRRHLGGCSRVLKRPLPKILVQGNCWSVRWERSRKRMGTFGPSMRGPMEFISIVPSESWIDGGSGAGRDP